jgi:NTE family protein
MKEKKLKIGIALGSGGAKGLAHIGVLKVLEKFGFKPDLVASSSMGAVIGAAYCLGMSLEEIEEKGKFILARTNIFNISNFHFFQESFIKAEDIRKIFYEFVGDKTFDDCKIPFMALGLDLESGKEVRITSGKLIDAIEASSAIPGIFPPVFIDEKYLVDGGLLNPTPVDYLREKNMDIIIGVHTTNITSKQFISGMIWEKFYKKPKGMPKTKRGMLEQAKLNMTLIVHILMRTIEVARKLNAKISFLTAHPDLIIRPYTMDIGMLEFDRIDEAIKCGKEAMEKELPKLFKIVEAKKKDKMDQNE